MKRDRRIKKGFAFVGKYRQHQPGSNLIKNSSSKSNHHHQQQKLSLMTEKLNTTIAGKLGSLFWKNDLSTKQQILPNYSSRNEKGNSVINKIIVLFVCFLLLMLLFVTNKFPIFIQLSSSVHNFTRKTTHNVGSANKQKKLPMLPRPGELAPIHSSTRLILPLVRLRHAPTTEYHIFSISSSTAEDSWSHLVLTNILMGLFDKEDEHLGILKWSSVGNKYIVRHRSGWSDSNTTIVSHARNVDMYEIQREFRTIYGYLIFILLHNNDKSIDNREPAECSLSNKKKNYEQKAGDSYGKKSHSAVMIVCFQASDLTHNVHDTDYEELVIARVIDKLQLELPYLAKVDLCLCKPSSS